jgi:hypothetical protein
VSIESIRERWRGVTDASVGIPHVEEAIAHAPTDIAVLLAVADAAQRLRDPVNGRAKDLFAAPGSAGAVAVTPAQERAAFLERLEIERQRPVPEWIPRPPALVDPATLLAIADSPPEPPTVVALPPKRRKRPRMAGVPFNPEAARLRAMEAL